MIRDRLLIWLFIIASVVVDFAFLTMARNGGSELLGVSSGLILGQTAALAIWAAVGQSHRLMRVSVLVVATGLLATMTGGYTLVREFEWLALLSGYTTLILVTTILINTLRERADIEAKPRRLQVPLIEFFGWTIIVAIISFVACHMEFNFFRVGDHVIEKIITLLAFPILLAIFIKKDIRDLGARNAFLLVGGWIAPAIFLQLRERWGAALIIAQANYLIIWQIVLTLDYLMSEARATEEKGLSDGETDREEPPNDLQE